MRAHPTALRLLLIAGAAALLCACGSDNQQQLDGVTATQIKAEYQDETQSLSLPAGSSFPDKTYDPQGRYQPGVGRNDADAFWSCAWMSTYLTTTGADQTAALDELKTIKTKYIYVHSYDDTTRQITDKQLTAADLGDPGPLRTEWQTNCG